MDVINFMRDRVAIEELPLVQAIEHGAYWNYYHAASPKIADAALEVRDAIEGRAEYQIYKQLVSRGNTRSMGGIKALGDGVGLQRRQAEASRGPLR